MRSIVVATLLLGVMPSAALAAPGLGSEVYGATIEPRELELESRYDRLTAGPADGVDVLKLEAAYGVNDNLRIGVFGEFDREPGAPRKAEEYGIEAIYHLGRIGPVDVAAYGEYALGTHGPDGLEGKILLQHRDRAVDLRLNLIGEKKLASGERVEFSYAASTMARAGDDFEIGLQAFGDIGTSGHLFHRAEHYVGPVARFEIEGLPRELEIETGYLFALGAAKDDTKGQLRFAVGVEF